MCSRLSGAVLFVCLMPLRAQPLTGEIRVEVKDGSGAPMQAAGKAERAASHLKRSFQTDAQGKVTIGGLPYGQYRLEISRSGVSTLSVLIDLQEVGARRSPGTQR